MKDDEIIDLGASAAYGGALAWLHAPEEERVTWRANFRKALGTLRAHGLEVVSVEPTEEMRIAALNTSLPGLGEPPLYEKIWRTMITAATPTVEK